MTRTVQLLRHDAYNCTITSAWRVQLYNYGSNQGCWWLIRFKTFDIVMITKLITISWFSWLFNFDEWGLIPNMWSFQNFCERKKRSGVSSLREWSKRAHVLWGISYNQQISSQLWSWQLWMQLEAWKSQDFNGVWTHDLVILVRRSKQLSYEASDCGFIAQLVRASHRYCEVTGSNPVEVLSSIRNCLNCIHNCDDHSWLDFESAVQYIKHFIYHFSNKYAKPETQFNSDQTKSSQMKSNAGLWEEWKTREAGGRLLGAHMMREWELHRGVIGGGQMLYALGPNVFTTSNNEFDFLFTPRIESSRDLKNNQWQTIFLSFKI